MNSMTLYLYQCLYLYLGNRMWQWLRLPFGRHHQKLPPNKISICKFRPAIRSSTLVAWQWNRQIGDQNGVATVSTSKQIVFPALWMPPNNVWRVCVCLSIDRSIGNWYRPCLPVVFDAWHCGPARPLKSLIKKILRYSIGRLSPLQILTSRLSQKSSLACWPNNRICIRICQTTWLPSSQSFGFLYPLSTCPSLRATLDFVCPAIEVSVSSASPQKRATCHTSTSSHFSTRGPCAICSFQ